MDHIKRLGAFSASALTAGLLAGIVGFASTFTVVIRGFLAAGASPAEAASGLMALSITMGLCAIGLSLKRRLPLAIAWSTPGAALLANAGIPHGGFPTAVGAFLAAAALVIAAGLIKPFGTLVSRIPPSLANAMLAGLLLDLCLAPVRAITASPALGLPIFLTWAIAGRIKRLLAVPAALLVTIGLIVATSHVSGLAGALWPHPVLILPSFSLAALAGIAIPLFIVTMASQNIPGLAVLNVFGYRPDPGPLFTITGMASLVAAPFGGHAVNLAALTAALCAGPDAHPDPARRYWAAVVNGSVYVVLGLGAGFATAFMSASPPILIEAVAGLALLGAFSSALLGALAEQSHREAAVVTFLVSASGMNFFGVAGAFWGLLAGGGMLLLNSIHASK